MSTNTQLSFPFRGRQVPVTVASSVPVEHAAAALQSQPFQTWYQRCERSSNNSDDKSLDIHNVEIQSVDMFGARKVGFVKIKSDCTLTDANGETTRLPGICFLRGNAVTILVSLFCQDSDEQYALLVEQPRVPIGQISCLELPAGMMDDETQSVTGIAVQEIREECGIELDASGLVDLSDLALQTPVRRGHLPVAAIPHSPGGCDEFCRYMYTEKRVTKDELDAMRGRLQGLRDHGENIVLRVVTMDEVWSLSGDAKAIIALFLSEQLRKKGRLAPPGGLATPLKHEPKLTLNNDMIIPQLAFGLYKVPATVEGEDIILNAIRAGYRHFDGAAFYQNEQTLGRALRRSGLPRQAFCITSKVWNDAVKEGRDAVKASVQKTLNDINFGDYLDICFVHWPVPGHFVEAYKALEEEHKNGSIRALGLSNFSVEEYQELVDGGIEVSPVCNQMEVSPVMYRASLVNFFMGNNIAVCASKALNRAAVLDNPTIVKVANVHKVTPAQVMLRWGLQKGLIVATKTSSLSRMEENRNIQHFVLTETEMSQMDQLTTPQALIDREKLEVTRKTSL